MLNPPKNKKEAQRRRYAEWAGNKDGVLYDSNKCAYEIFATESYPVIHGPRRQCSRKPGHGPGKIYCKQHSEKVRLYYDVKALKSRLPKKHQMSYKYED